VSCDDRYFVRRLRNHDPASWSQLFGVFYKQLRVVAFKICGHRTSEENIDDLVQETLAAALRSIDRFRGESGLATWLTSILRKKCIDFCHCKGRRPLISLSNKDINRIPCARSRPPDIDARLAIFSAGLEDLIASEKPGRIRRSTLEFIRRLLDERGDVPSLRQMAEIWGCSEPAAKARWSDAKKALERACKRKLQEMRSQDI